MRRGSVRGEQDIRGPRGARFASRRSALGMRKTLAPSFMDAVRCRASRFAFRISHFAFCFLLFAFRNSQFAVCSLQFAIRGLRVAVCGLRFAGHRQCAVAVRRETVLNCIGLLCVSLVVPLRSRLFAAVRFAFVSSAAAWRAVMRLCGIPFASSAMT